MTPEEYAAEVRRAQEREDMLREVRSLISAERRHGSDTLTTRSLAVLTRVVEQLHVSDRRFLEMRRECFALTDYCGKVLEAEIHRRPTPEIVMPPGDKITTHERSNGAALRPTVPVLPRGNTSEPPLDLLCRCGHRAVHHIDGENRCLQRTGESECACTAFVRFQS